MHAKLLASIIEPGYYKEDDFGIRTENIIRTVDATPDGNYLKFEDVTLAPIQLKLIDTKLLTEAEVRHTCPSLLEI